MNNAKKFKKVLAGGCFNSLHPGHVFFLKEARKLGDFLVVVLTSDVHNKKPYAVPALQRKRELEKLGIADRVVIGDEEDYSAVVRNERPDIIALGYDQKLLGSTEDAVRKMGIDVVRITKFGTYSTGSQSS